MSIGVLVVDDQAVIREGLMTLLGMMPGIEVVGGAKDGEEAVAQAAALRPDAVLMDLGMPGVGGVEATRRIVAEHPDIAVVVLTTLADDRLILDALQAGARAYLTKDADKTQITRAVEAAVSRHTTLDPVVRQRLLDAAVRGAAAAPPNPGPAPVEEALTPRETDVLRLLARGLPNAAIGRRLLVGEATVKTHVNHLYAKLGVRTRAEAVAWAHRHGYGLPADGASAPPGRP